MHILYQNKRMDSSHDEKRMNVEEDRLSSLPDDIIHKILSFISVKYAIQTSVLSSRWRFIWTSMPNINFSRDDFSCLTKFSKFVIHVLFDRDNIDVSSVKLNFYGENSEMFVKKIMKYAFSHNIQQLNVACVLEEEVDFPLCLFRSRSLKHLSLAMKVFSAIEHHSIYSLTYVFKETSIWELPALTTLYLDNAALICDEDADDKCIDLFSKCPNLKDLTLKACYTEGFKGLSIRLPKLSNLRIEIACGSVEFFNIVAPQLKNLTIRSYFGQRYLLSAPDLEFLFYQGCYCLQLTAGGFLSLEKADICVPRPKDAHQVLRMLQHLRSVKVLTLNVEIVELLSSYVELITQQPSPFANLKSLKIQPDMEFSNLGEDEGVEMSAEVRSYLLDGSPDATLTMVTREDVRAIKNTKLAQRLITKLSSLLEQEKDSIETEMAKMHEQGKAHVDTDMSWNDLSMQILNGEEKASGIISKLKEINGILIELPESNRATIQPSFSTLCAEADIVMKKTTDLIKMVCDENQRCLSVCFHDVTTALRPS